MAAAYSKKTNSDLIEMLKSRGLTHTGKKADLVARLVEADKAAAETSGAASASAKADAAADDVIDWDDDATTLEPTAAATVAVSTNATDANSAVGAKETAATSATTAKQKIDTDPSTTHDLTVKKPADPKEASTTTSAGETKDANGAVEGETVEAKVAGNYSMGLATTDIDTELEKRKKRAEKFGIVDDDGTKEAQKAAERAKRFGTGSATSSGVKGLDEPLPEQARKRGRGFDDGDSYHRGGKRRNFSGRGRGRNTRRTRDDNGSSYGNKASNWSEQDRSAMEKRRARFG
ncbi:hypothetical protein LOZ53_004494 [Ophidiomyces ophidiicola]|uniref:Uncharacterized protein n=1 Tax=Ophidiomyces ophidiicola TaxID=1387563 RepID=A0ACB8URD7_9EURO|nr:uncharacterized protein LOZ57_001163 [Ophidiomyces ophidiicola]KAI1916134.1 hypothetical protein LOZ64_003397 [Ophidiomyces ophidiicola]KAI1916944.1 hypothetical protein LOZ61_000847 [Ophidiomyces ophidiicola]KAI1924923.1 hypothetical protein LOZ60_004447 [Ophidiomyces ophidiicola]KAI1948690.1 hypothetical protein LOZ62_002639 [Ophidiomyces ophidiicola]KAI1951751.1 hypothetical protein LOZ57_001163 [Ophidiomyces ophidiicola]